MTEEVSAAELFRLGGSVFVELEVELAEKPEELVGVGESFLATNALAAELLSFPTLNNGISKADAEAAIWICVNVDAVEVE